MLKNKIILLTGATAGIGKRAAFMMAQAGAVLLMHGKNFEKGNLIKDEIIKKTQNQKVYYFNADFTSFSEINKLASRIHERFSYIDILVNNAGVFEDEKIILKNGFEKTFMVNHLASFSLTIQLLDLLKRGKDARIINVSSMTHAQNIDFKNLNAKKNYSGYDAYSLTKLCNILFTYELNEILKKEKATVNAVHPGVINTKLLKAGWGAIGGSLDEGAERILYLAETKEIANVSGKYFMNDKPMNSAEVSYNKNIRKELWNLSLKFIKSKKRV